MTELPSNISTMVTPNLESSTNRDKSVEAEASLADPRVLVGSGSGVDLIPFRNGIFFIS